MKSKLAVFNFDKLFNSLYNFSMNKFNNLVDQNIFDDVWATSMKLFGLFDNKFCKEFKSACEDFENPTPELLETKFNKWLNIYYKNIKKLDYKSHYNADKAIALIEVFTSNSVLINNVLILLQNDYGEDYINIVEQIDKKIYNKPLKKSLLCYKIIASWQEKMSKVINETSTTYNSVRDNFINKHKIISQNINEIDVLLYKLDILNRKKIFNINKLVEIQKVLPDLSFSELYGGKVDGLIKLKTIGAKVPKTFICVSKDISNTFLPMLKNYAIRSSFSLEDGKKQSFAGMFESFINIQRDNALECINKVFNSADNARVNSYAKNIDGHMTVIIQETVIPDYSGVFFGNVNNINEGVVEYTNGFGEQIVGGLVVPNRIYNDTCDKLKFVYNKCLKNQKTFNVACDIEWVVKNKKLIFVQMRNVTTNNIYLFNPSQSRSSSVIASRGVVEGKPVFMDEITDKFEEGNILVTWYTDPDWVPYILKSKGVLVGLGGFLSHAAIVCREYSIPCICAFGNENIERVAHAKKIKLDAENNNVEILE